MNFEKTKSLIKKIGLGGVALLVLVLSAFGLGDAWDSYVKQPYIEQGELNSSNFVWNEIVTKGSIVLTNTDEKGNVQQITLMPVFKDDPSQTESNNLTK